MRGLPEIGCLVLVDGIGPPSVGSIDLAAAQAKLGMEDIFPSRETV